MGANDACQRMLTSLLLRVTSGFFCFIHPRCENREGWGIKHVASALAIRARSFGLAAPG